MQCCPLVLGHLHWPMLPPSVWWSLTSWCVWASDLDSSQVRQHFDEIKRAQAWCPLVIVVLTEAELVVLVSGAWHWVTLRVYRGGNGLAIALEDNIIHRRLGAILAQSQAELYVLVVTEPMITKVTVWNQPHIYMSGKISENNKYKHMYTCINQDVFQTIDDLRTNETSYLPLRQNQTGPNFSTKLTGNRVAVAFNSKQAP